MLRNLCFLTTVLGLAAAASASPTLTYTATSLGGGLTAYDVTVNDAADPAGSYGISGVFTALSGATISQIQAFSSIAVNDQAQATNFAAIPAANYSSTNDSWLYDPFGANLNGTQQETSTTYSVNAGSGAVALQTTLFAHIVASGSVQFTGDVGHLGGDVFYDNTVGTGHVAPLVMNPGTPAPEPASLGVLALGGLALLARRRKA